MCWHAEVNAFVRREEHVRSERVHEERGTRSHEEMNMAACERKRAFVIPCIWTVLYIASQDY